MKERQNLKMTLGNVKFVSISSYQRTFNICTRAVESESPKVGKSLKIGKNQIKSEKLDLISYPNFWQKCQNATKCQNACTSGQGPASEYFFKRL